MRHIVAPVSLYRYQFKVIVKLFPLLISMLFHLRVTREGCHRHHLRQFTAL